MTNEINGFSNLRPLGGVESNKPSARSQHLQRLISMTNPRPSQTKMVTQADIDNALLESPRNAIIGLIKASPLGFGAPDTEKLFYMGYSGSYHRELDGSYIYNGKDGKVITYPEAEDGTQHARYETNKYTQDMIYDKDGNLKSATIIIRDDFGNVEKTYDMVIGEDGKAMYIDG